MVYTARMVKTLVFVIALFLVALSAVLVPSVAGVISALVVATWLFSRVMSS